MKFVVLFLQFRESGFEFRAVPYIKLTANLLEWCRVVDSSITVGAKMNHGSTLHKISQYKIISVLG